MPCVRSTFTRRSGFTTVNLLVKCVETSSPLDAISAISSAVSFVLGVFDLALLGFRMEDHTGIFSSLDPSVRKFSSVAAAPHPAITMAMGSAVVISIVPSTIVAIAASVN